MCGVKIGLFFPLNTLATSAAQRPNVIPSASTTYHFLPMVAGLAIKVFIDIPPKNNVMKCFHNVNVQDTSLCH